MSGARVQNLEVLRQFKIALIKFADMTKVALGDAEGEISKTVNWLGHEQQTYWNGQIRKRQELVMRCKEAVRQKKLFKDSAGRTQSAVDEEKQLMKAQRHLEAAEQKLAATKRHSAKLQKEMHMYKGAVARLMSAATSDIPNAANTLETLATSLDAYVNLEGGSVPEPTAAASGEESMSRGTLEEAPETEEAAEKTEGAAESTDPAAGEQAKNESEANTPGSS
jgi:hypothetical protein